MRRSCHIRHTWHGAPITLRSSAATERTLLKKSKKSVRIFPCPVQDNIILLKLQQIADCLMMLFPVSYASHSQLPLLPYHISALPPLPHTQASNVSLATIPQIIHHGRESIILTVSFQCIITAVYTAVILMVALEHTIQRLSSQRAFQKLRR